jgi:hypothetical protein
LNTIALFLLLATTLGALAYIFYLKVKEKQFTKSRFAFTALLTFVSLCMFTFSIIFTSSPFQLVIGAINQLPLVNLPTGQPGSFDKILILLVLFMVYQLINNLYKGWEGPKSVEQAEWEKLNNPRPMLFEGALEAGRLIKREKLTLYGQEESSNSGPQWNRMDTPKYERIWHQHCRELIELSSMSYVFDKDDDWHDLQNCWIGTNKKTQETVVIYCPANQPDKVKIDDAIAYAAGINNQPIATVFVISEQAIEAVLPTMFSPVKVELKTEGQLLDALVDFGNPQRQLNMLVNKNHLPNSELTLS